MKKHPNYHNNMQPGKSGTDTVECASVNEKIQTEVISMYIVDVWVGYMCFRKVVKTYVMLNNCS